MPPNITNLPLELLSEIIRNVISKEDLCQLRSVNSLFETLATPENFKSIIVRNNKQSADGFWSLLLTSRIASHVQSISFVEEYTLAEKEVQKRLKAAFSILHEAPGLKTLELHLCPYFFKSFHYHGILYQEYYSHQRDIVYALGNNRNPLPALQSLKIDGWLCGGDEEMLLFDKAPITWLAASLRHLSFTVPKSTQTNKLESLERFWKQVLVRRVLQPAVHLESLVITGRGGRRRREAQCFDVSQVQFPRLAALSLRHIIWEDVTSDQGDTVPLEFIMRHQKTLKKLELHNCAINVRNRFGPPHRYWADTYRRLANALTGLVELKVEFELEDSHEIPYVYFGGPHSPRIYLNKDDLKGRAPDAALAQDALALEEFRAVVKSQGMGGG